MFPFTKMNFPPTSVKTKNRKQAKTTNNYQLTAIDGVDPWLV